MKDAYRQAKRDYYASQVLWIISCMDPFCRTLGLEYIPVTASGITSEQVA